MGTGYGTARVIAWAQTRVEGLPAEPESELVEGMSWSWHGTALSLDGEPAALVLTASRDLAQLRTHAARMVQKVAHHTAPGPADFAADGADVLFRGAFVVSDGAQFFTLVPILIEDGAAPLLMFVGDAPPMGRDLSIVYRNEHTLRAAPSEAPSVICFTPGTRIRTEGGDVPIEHLGPGDQILTRDNGRQEIEWIGNRRISGARLFAMPRQRPIRLRAGALGEDRPDADLLVSPDHRILLHGRAALDLWGEPEVLVRAADLVDDARIMVDHAVRETTYIHLMLPRHEVIWANGLEVDSFHPGFSGLDHLSGMQREILVQSRPEIADDPYAYGPAARRMLTRAEAAILMQGAPGHALRARARAA